MTMARKRLVICFLVVLVVFGVVFSAAPNTALAAESSLSFDKTVNGQPFDVKDYPYDEDSQAQIVNFVEYCYSYKGNMQSNYGLYVYVYNPQGLNISTNSKSNKIQMAVSYDSEGKPNNYAKFDLQFLSKSENSDYKNLFYKFKVVDREINGTTFKDRVNSNERRYDVSGIELVTYGANNATEYPVNGTYKFTGYAAGYGPDAGAKSTLESSVEYLETITLDVKHTFYRTQTSSKGAGYQNQLDTVYFAVPQRFFDTYGKLQRIKAEWYEYKTKDIVVTSNQEFYDQAYAHIGEYFGYNYNDSVLSLGQQAGDGGGGMMVAKWGWNLGNNYLHVPADALYYLFKVDDIEEYDPYADIVSIGGVESNALYEYIKNYNKTFDNGTLPIKDGTISADLFADDIDDYRKMDTEFGKIQQGYSYYDFDADVDLQKLTSWQAAFPKRRARRFRPSTLCRKAIWTATTTKLRTGFSSMPTMCRRFGTISKTPQRSAARTMRRSRSCCSVSPLRTTIPQRWTSWNFVPFFRTSIRAVRHIVLGRVYSSILTLSSSPSTGTAYIRSFPWCPALWISSTR